MEFTEIKEHLIFEKAAIEAKNALGSLAVVTAMTQSSPELQRAYHTASEALLDLVIVSVNRTQELLSE